jgi:ribosomal protein S18 acetylase RimI-like enzyme
MIPEPIIRRARKEDVAVAMEIEQSGFTAFALSKRQLHYHQQRQSSIFLVAEHAHRVVGDGIALLRNHKGSISGRIYSLVVRSDCRGQKIGTKVLTALLAELQSRDVRRVYLEVEESNLAALHLYERSGFRKIGTLPDYYGAGKSGVHMMYEAPVRQPTTAGRE